MSADPNLAYLASSASIIEIGMSGVRMTLAEGSKCILQQSRRGARRDALTTAQAARDRLEVLIEALGGE